MKDTDTIFALSSGVPPGGVAVVRVSGPEARYGLETLVGPAPEPRKLSLRLIKGSENQVLDRGLVAYFPGPGSFTGEDVVELHLHGGRAVVAGVLAALARMPGYRPAEAGEFTRRAFLNRRLDLTQVEGLADLVAAETEAQRRQALRQSEGTLRDLYEGWRERLVRGRAMIEAELDFSEEEELPATVVAEAGLELMRLAEEIGRHLDDQRQGERLREGAEIVVLGPTNAGKSSLINCLARRDVAIVSDEPGTTRDAIEVRLDLGGYPVTVVDTAGLREAAGIVEAEGVRRSESRAASADLVLWLSDVTAAAAPVPSWLAGPVMRIGTKIDLIDSAIERARLGAPFDVAISTVSGEGLEKLVDRLEGFAGEALGKGEAPSITRLRYRVALEACRDAVMAAQTAEALELRAEELRRAADAIGRITGRIDVEDLLDVIFREFCIGK